MFVTTLVEILRMAPAKPLTRLLFGAAIMIVGVHLSSDWSPRLPLYLIILALGTAIFGLALYDWRR